MHVTKKFQIYKCPICGNVVEVLTVGGGELVCCGQPMELLKEKTEDVGSEKHVPVVEESERGIRVRVGSIPHPMEKTHYIEWIEVVTNSKVYKKFLNPNDKPEVEFALKKEEITKVRAYCNLHGLWKNKD